MFLDSYFDPSAFQPRQSMTQISTLWSFQCSWPFRTSLACRELFNNTASATHCQQLFFIFSNVFFSSSMFCMVLSSAVLSAPPCCLATALVIYQIYLPLSTLLFNFFHFLFRLFFLSLYNAFMMLFPGSSVPTAGITAAAHLPQIFTVHVLKIPAKQQDSFQFFVIHKRIVCLCIIYIM